ncbi:hypothetical protein [Rhizobium tumorigenes]|uniref:Uncharacterized protein n=1 Tax=Rhizobium tumorigenes TaxID=2041385 RepID=A0AAF1K4F7_9HYPH|nr:hypothetical protein [Rhizobium tumorigenes]WFR95549.1 hypothetical protein PR017_17605 [Rhizobium tumorigenes]WFS01039.1 hypothetical protein PR016_18480 [Rhizobium tumorigenes]
MTSVQDTKASRQSDPRDRLIVALYAQLKAERETREALEWLIHNGTLSSEVLEAVAGDAVPAVSSDELAAVEKIVALDNRRRGH